MNVWEALLLGVVQGLTEFLPVSSSGHLALVQRWLHWVPSQAIAFDVVVHLGTLLAVVVAFRRELLSIARARPRAVWPLFLATLPLGLALPLREQVQRVQDSPLLLGLAFFVTAGVLLSADWPFRALPAEPPREPGAEPPREPGAEPPQEATPRLEDVGAGRALAVGFAQLCAIMPGISRSGSTISCGLLLGLPPALAGELSFLMSIPAVLGATVVEARHIGEQATVNPLAMLAGFLSALVSGLLAIALLRWLLSRRRLWVFVPWLLLVGLLSVATG